MESMHGLEEVVCSLIIMHCISRRQSGIACSQGWSSYHHEPQPRQHEALHLPNDGFGVYLQICKHDLSDNRRHDIKPGALDRQSSLHNDQT